MIIHRTTYAFYTLPTEEAKIIEGCKRSNGNASKVYHKVNGNGDIVQSKLFDLVTETLVVTPTSVDMELRSRTQRIWGTEKHKIFDSNIPLDQKQAAFDKLADRFHFDRETLEDKLEAKHLVISGDPVPLENVDKVIFYNVKITGGETKLGPLSNVAGEFIRNGDIFGKIYAGLINKVGQEPFVTSDDFFFTGKLESITASLNLIATVDDVPFQVTIGEPDKLGPELIIRGKPSNPNNDKIAYTVMFDGGIIAKGPAASAEDKVVGNNIEGFIRPKTGKDNYLFTGNLLRINSPVDLDAKVDGVPVDVTVG